MNRYESERSNRKMHVIHKPAFLCLQYASKNKQVGKGNNCHHPLWSLYRKWSVCDVRDKYTNFTGNQYTGEWFPFLTYYCHNIEQQGTAGHKDIILHYAGHKIVCCGYLSNQAFKTILGWLMVPFYSIPFDGLQQTFFCRSFPSNSRVVCQKKVSTKSKTNKTNN